MNSSVREEAKAWRERRTPRRLGLSRPWRWSPP